MCRLTVALLLLFSSCQIVVAQDRALPRPSGKHAVGVVATIIVDRARPEILTENDSTDWREVPLRIWYPASHTDGAPAPYLADSALWNSYFGREFFDMTQRVRTNSFEHARPLAGELPVIFFEPGNGQVPEFYTTLIEDLASHGFLVIGFNHTYDFQPVRLQSGEIARRRVPAPEKTFAHVKRLIGLRISDMEFTRSALVHDNVLRSLLPGVRPAVDQVIAIGHSRGGVTAFEACKRNYITACLNLDGGVLGGAFYDDSIGTALRAPALWLQMIHEVPSDAKLAEWKMSRMQWDSFDIRANRMLARGPSAWRIVMNATSHMGFSDLDWLRPEPGQITAPLQTLLEARTIVTRFAELARCRCFNEMERITEGVRTVSRQRLR